MSITPPPPTAQSPYGQPGPAVRTNTLAIVAFVLAFFASIAAIVCGHIALAQIKQTGEAGRGFAIAALVLGYLSVLATIVALIVVFAILLPSGVFDTANLPSY